MLTKLISHILQKLCPSSHFPKGNKPVDENQLKKLHIWKLVCLVGSIQLSLEDSFCNSSTLAIHEALARGNDA